ncbi:hypothetical protein QP175_15450 [Sphingomonas aerolata]
MITCRSVSNSRIACAVVGSRCRVWPRSISRARIARDTRWSSRSDTLTISRDRRASSTPIVAIAAPSTSVRITKVTTPPVGTTRS